MTHIYLCPTCQKQHNASPPKGKGTNGVFVCRDCWRKELAARSWEEAKPAAKAEVTLPDWQRDVADKIQGEPGATS